MRPPSEKQLDILRLVMQGPGCSIAEVIHDCAHFFRGRPILADYRFIDRMVKRGLIRKEKGKGNAKRLFITDLGRAYVS